MFIIISCSNSRIVQSPEYDDELIERSLSVSIDFTNLLVSNEDDITDDLGEGKPADLYKNFFLFSLLNNLRTQSNFKKVSIDSSINREQFEQNILAINSEEKLTIRLPKNNIPNNSLYDFTLLIENVSIGNNYRPSKNYTRKALLHKMNYAIWDNKVSKVVSYGILEVETEEFFPVITKGTWESSVRTIVQEIISASPFKKKLS